MARNATDSSSRPFILLLAVVVFFVWFNTSNVPATPPGHITDLESAELEKQIKALEYENVARARAVQDAQELIDKFKEEAAAAVANHQLASATLTGKDIQERCVLWAYEYSVKPGVDWGTLPDPLRQEWMTLSCHDHLVGSQLDNSMKPPPPPPPQVQPQVQQVVQAVQQQPSMIQTSVVQNAPIQTSNQKVSSVSANALVPSLGANSRSVLSDPLRSSADNANPKKYQGYTFWSSDFHISPIADLKDLFKPLGMKIIDKSLSGHCHLKKTCAKDLRVLTKGNGINMGKCPNQLRRDFFKSYQNDPLMRGVDAMLCNHACGLCEAYMPFNKSLVVVVSTRYEIGRHEPKRWRMWNENLKAIASHPRNVVAANNRYDAEYVKYFTGIKEVLVLPNYCAYTHALYNPSKPQILIGPGRGINDQLYKELMRASGSSGVKMARIRDLYPHFEYTDLVKHPAIVLIPYQVSIMSIFEYYRMGIPIFVPSTALLARWQAKYRVMDERTWNGVFKRFKKESDISKHPSVNNPYDPNNEFDLQAIKHWIAYADFYQWPYIETFDSFEDLMGKLAKANLKETSKKMMAYNAQAKEELLNDWQLLFHRMFHGLKPAAQEPRLQIPDFDQAMRAKYGISVNPTCLGETHSISYD